ncbi:hypothetical protein [Halegenticoccus soli]|uniref:hypothetical protein n=1 Tax=Halegenticoccus soli TaxID=1985678 RepID=UPI000C6DD579|nr:hypothetical protein [Halegenticoccus soli]
MSDAREQLLKQVNEKQAVGGLDPETRMLIGLLGETILAFGEEIDDLRQRVAELEDDAEERDKRAWYSEQ